MSRPSRTDAPGSSFRGAGGFRTLVRAAGAAAVLTLPGCATPEPAQLNAAFVEPADRTTTAAPTPAPAHPCKVHVVELRDGRRAPETLGVLTGRAVKSPADTQAWLRSVVGGLDARGFQIDFDTPPSPSPDAVSAKVALQSAWVTAISTNKTANVVLHVQANGPSSQAIDRDYRGDVSNLNWASTDGEIRRVVDYAFAKALDSIAADLRPLCPA
jgi:hypothetical protein